MKLNGDKTEVMLFGTKHKLAKMNSVFIHIGNNIIYSSSSCRNLGVIQDQNLSVDLQVTNTCCPAYLHLRNIGHIYNYLTIEATKSLVHALVTLRLVYRNALYSGATKFSIKKLQKVQNTAVRMITRANLISTSHLFWRSYAGGLWQEEYSSDCWWMCIMP